MAVQNQPPPNANHEDNKAFTDFGRMDNGLPAFRPKTEDEVGQMNDACEIATALGLWSDNVCIFQTFGQRRAVFKFTTKFAKTSSFEWNLLMILFFPSFNFRLATSPARKSMRRKPFGWFPLQTHVPTL